MAASLRIEIFPADLDATVLFYRSALNFSLNRDERGAEVPYVALQRDGVRIGARQATGQPSARVTAALRPGWLLPSRHHAVMLR